MDFKLLDLKDSGKSNHYRCSDHVGNRPRGLSKIALHAKEGYRDATKGLDLGWSRLTFSMAHMGNIVSYTTDAAAAKTEGAGLGWTLIGSAFDAGGDGNYIG